MIRYMTYTKDSGEVSQRKVIEVSKPRDNYLVYDVTKLTEDETAYFEKILQELEEDRNEAFGEFEAVTGIKINSLWRSFKPGGIDWKE